MNMRSFIKRYDSLINEIELKLHEEYIKHTAKDEEIAWFFNNYVHERTSVLPTTNNNINVRINLLTIADILHLGHKYEISWERIIMSILKYDASVTIKDYLTKGQAQSASPMAKDDIHSRTESLNEQVPERLSVSFEAEGPASVPKSYLTKDALVMAKNKKLALLIAYLEKSKILPELKNELLIYLIAVHRFLVQHPVILCYYTTTIIDHKSLDFTPRVLCIDIDCIKNKLKYSGKSLWRIIKDNSLLLCKYENSNTEQINFWHNEYMYEYINTKKNSYINVGDYPNVYYKFIEVDKYTGKNQVDQNLFIKI